MGAFQKNGIVNAYVLWNSDLLCTEFCNADYHCGGKTTSNVIAGVVLLDDNMNRECRLSSRPKLRET